MLFGVAGRHKALSRGSGRGLESPAKEGKSPVDETLRQRAVTQSTAGHEKSGGKQEGPPSKAKYDLVTDSA